MSQVSEIIVKWTPITSGRAREIQIQSRIVGTDQWTPQGERVDPALGELRFQSNAPSTHVEVRCRVVSTDNIPGDWFSADITTAPAVVEYDTVTGAPKTLAELDPPARELLDGSWHEAQNASAAAGVADQKAVVADGKAQTAVDALKNPNTQKLYKVSDIVVDVDGLRATYGSTESAAASANKADVAKNAAEAARDITNQAKATTETARDAATSARDAASTAEASARAKASESAQSAHDAAGSATTAIGQATIATQKAELSDHFASISEARANDARTEAGKASTSSNNAATSENNALGSQNAAASSATVAATNAADAFKVAADSLPSDFSQGSKYWFNRYQGDPADPRWRPENNGWTFPIVEGAKVAQSPPTSGGVNSPQSEIAQSGLLPLVAGRRYRMSAEVRYISGVAPFKFQVAPHGIGNDRVSYNYASAGAGATTINELNTWSKSTFEFSTNEVNAPFTRALVRDELVNGAVFQVRYLRIEDVTSEAAANGSASAAAISASNAFTSEGKAGHSAGAASTSATNANTDAGRASTSASQASTSASNAKGSENAAASSASLSAQSATDATNKANAAATSATSASASENNAGQSASAASASATNAGTKAGEASTSASQAATSATNAKGSENAASSSASVAASSARDAGGAAVSDNRSPGAAPSLWTFNDFSTFNAGGPVSAIVASRPDLATIVGGRLRVQNNGQAHCGPIKPVPIVQGRRYRVRFVGRAITLGDTIEAVIPCWDGNGTYLSYSYHAGGAYGYADTLVTFTLSTVPGRAEATFLPYDSDATRGGIAYARPCIIARGSNGAVTEIIEVSLVDVESELAASGSASAAAGSASTASTKADQAGQSASAANTSKVQAEAANGAAQGAASNAQSSAATASAKASEASSSANLAASYSASTEGNRRNLIKTEWWKTGAAIPWSDNAGIRNLIYSFPNPRDPWNNIAGADGSAADVWLAQAGTDGGAGGGWNNGPIAPLDPDKTYRFMVPIAQLGDGGSQSYWGTVNVCDLNTGNPAGNPYFAYGGGFTPNRWYMFVGYIFPRNSTGKTHDGAGVWDIMTGQKILAGNNFCFRPDGVQPLHRAYQYYASSGRYQAFGRPLVECVDGSETPLPLLLNTKLDAFTNAAAIRDEASARATADSSITSRQTTLEARAGKVESRVTSAEGAIATVDGKTQAYFEKKASVPGADAFISAVAKNDNGVATSNVAIGGTSIALYNLDNGQAKRAMYLSGGNAIFNGSITADGGVLIGNGKLPVQVQSFDRAVSDGTYVNYGITFTRPPAINFGGSPVALASGEVPNFYAENLTTSGFTARLRINSAPQSSAQATGAFARQGDGAYQVNTGGRPAAANGQYTLTVSMDASNYAYDDGGGPYPLQ